MSTPLNDSSGTGFFGKGFWGRKVFWLNVPSQWRHFDASQNDYLQRLLLTWGDAGEDLLGHIALLPKQRDPYEVRTRSTWNRWFYVTEAFVYDDEDKGQVVRLIGERKLSDMPETDEGNPPSTDESILEEWFPWFPYELLADVGRFWQLYWQDAQYEVINVRARNYDPPYASDGVTPIYNEDTSLANEVWVKGGDLSLLFDYFGNRDWNLDVVSEPVLGTAQIGITDGSQRPVIEFPVVPVRLTPNVNSPSGLSSDSRIVIRIPQEGGGYITLYDVQDSVDGNIGTLHEADGGGNILAPEWGAINYLSGQVSVDMSIGSAFSSESRLPIKAKFVVRGYYMLFNAPPNIGYLSQDFGFNNDENDPEDVQRSSIANVTKFWGLKATQNSYQIRGQISLFDVVMQGLYRVCAEEAGWIPPENLIQIGDTFYTDVRPIFIKFDHIASDEFLYDYDDGVSPQWVTIIDNMLVAENLDRWDGMTIGQAYAVDVTQGYYGQISPLNSNVRGPAIVPTTTALTDPEYVGSSGVVALTNAELDELGWENGFRYFIRMKRCQFEAFNFPTDAGGLQSPELFALSVYDYNANPALGVPPDVADAYYYIDKEEQTWTLTSAGATSQEDVGEWVVLIRFGLGTASPISVNDDVAVRYLPTFDSIDCCYCRSNNMRAIVDVSEEAYDFYDNYDDVEHAIARLKPKLLELVPIHARVAEWEVTRRYEDEMFGVQNGATVEHDIGGEQFLNNSQVLMTVQFRGDSDGAGKDLDFSLRSAFSGVVWQELNWTDGVDDNETWRDVVTDVEVSLPNWFSHKVYTKAIAGASSAYGDVRWIFKITTKE